MFLMVPLYEKTMICFKKKKKFWNKSFPLGPGIFLPPQELVIDFKLLKLPPKEIFFFFSNVEIFFWEEEKKILRGKKEEE